MTIPLGVNLNMPWKEVDLERVAKMGFSWVRRTTHLGWYPSLAQDVEVAADQIALAHSYGLRVLDAVCLKNNDYSGWRFLELANFAAHMARDAYVDVIGVGGELNNPVFNTKNHNAQDVGFLTTVVAKHVTQTVKGARVIGPALAPQPWDQGRDPQHFTEAMIDRWPNEFRTCGLSGLGINPYCYGAAVVDPIMQGLPQIPDSANYGDYPEWNPTRQIMPTWLGAARRKVNVSMWLGEFGSPAAGDYGTEHRQAYFMERYLQGFNAWSALGCPIAAAFVFLWRDQQSMSGDPYGTKYMGLHDAGGKERMVCDVVREYTTGRTDWTDLPALP